MLQTEMATFRSYSTYPLNAPGSQESLASYGSGTATSASRSFRAAGSDTVSQTTADTEMTSPTSPTKPVYNMPVPAAGEQHRATTGWRMHTPEDRINASDVNTKMASPVAVTTPVNGHKRMASGQIKNSELPSPGDASRSGFGHSARAASVGSAGSRVSEAASNLKERLSYAMAKVQHGWEHHNIDQVEQLAAAAISPRTVISPRSARSRVQHTSPRSAGLPSRALVDQFSTHHRAPFHDNQQSLSAPLPTSSSEGSMSPPQKRRVNDPPALAPAARFVTPPSPSHRRSTSINHPETPKPANRTPATSFRTQTQTAAAEQEAMSALLLMGSPSNSQPFAARRGSQSHSQQSSATQSPRRSQHLQQQQPPPRMALKYRSESGESFGSSLSEGRRGRDEVLDRIEAEG